MSQFLVPFILLYGLIQIKPLCYSSRILPKLTFHVKTFNPEYWLDVITTRIYVSAFQLDVKYLTFKKFACLLTYSSWFGIRCAALRTRLEPTGEANRGQVRRNKAILNETGDMMRLHSTCSCRGNVKKADSNDETTIILNNIFK